MDPIRQETASDANTKGAFKTFYDIRRILFYSPISSGRERSAHHSMSPPS